MVMTKAPLSSPDTNCFALSGLRRLPYLFPGLAPWAFLRRPFGASFVTETSDIVETARRAVSTEWPPGFARDKILFQAGMNFALHCIGEAFDK